MIGFQCTIISQWNGDFTLRLLVLGLRKMTVSTQTAIVLSLETPVREKVNEGMLFKDEYNTNLFA